MDLGTDKTVKIMMLLLPLILGLSILLLLILYFRIPAFLALLIATLVIGLVSGVPVESVLATIQKGMGATLGYVAVVVGLGALFGALLEKTGSARQLAQLLLEKTGQKHAPWALMCIGFILAIPVFFDVAFIILIPVLYALQQKTGKSLLLFALPLLAGLAVTHAFIPPTPGPIAVAEILGADLGWVIIAGVATGLPAAIVSGIVFGRFIANRIHIKAPYAASIKQTEILKKAPVSLGEILAILLLPIILIVTKALLVAGVFGRVSPIILSVFTFLGHPFTALILANLMAWYFLGIRSGYSKEVLYRTSMASFAPAGTILLLTGAGGALKEMLIATSIGEQMAALWLNEQGTLFGLAFGAAVLVRVLQGSSTVAMITAAGIVAPLLEKGVETPLQLSLLVVSIASGASIFSHVNDSGFWLVSQYLGLTEKQTFWSWTLMTTLLALVGFAMVLLFLLFL